MYFVSIFVFLSLDTLTFTRLTSWYPTLPVQCFTGPVLKTRLVPGTRLGQYSSREMPWWRGAQLKRAENAYLDIYRGKNHVYISRFWHVKTYQMPTTLTSTSFHDWGKVKLDGIRSRGTEGATQSHVTYYLSTGLGACSYMSLTSDFNS